MLCRKQIGLLALGCAFIHAIYTLVIPLRYKVTHDAIAEAVSAVRPRGLTNAAPKMEKYNVYYDVCFCVCAG